MSRLPDVWIIAGPTASGKSALALELATHHNGVIVNADSMQVYREIPVLTAQPSAQDMTRVPHYLYGFQPIAQNYSSAQWARDAVSTIRTCLADGKRVILVGGSGLYLRALTQGFSPIPHVPNAIRNQVTDLYDMLGPNGFHNALMEIDTTTAQRLHPTDRQRCIRAREVFEASGETLSHWQAQPTVNPAPDLLYRSITILPDRDWLYDRINRRFVDMIAHGALDEARMVNTHPPDDDATGGHALGLGALRDHLDGRITLNEAIEQGQSQSRQYAKRQYTWFRGQDLPNGLRITAPASQWLDRATAHLLQSNS